MAQGELGQIPDAIRDFEGVIRAVPDHPSAHFQLSRLYRRVDRADDAARELEEHQRIQARLSSPVVTVAALERCQYTQPLSPFVLSQPDPHGIPVRFAEDTAAAFGVLATGCRGPLAAIDYDHDGRPSLFAQDKSGGFLLLDDRGGRFTALGRPLRVPAAGGYLSLIHI